MRLFIAIDIPDDIKNELSLLIQDLRQKGDGIKWVNPLNIHITLKFIGEVEEPFLIPLKEKLQEVKMSGRPSMISILNYGFFPDKRRPRVIWVGLSDKSGYIKNLAAEINKKLFTLNIERDSREFSPHLTIGRIKHPVDTRSLENRMERYKDKEFGSFTPGQFHLYQSILKPAGPEYRKLKSYSL